jgi:hypothetical protein
MNINKQLQLFLNWLLKGEIVPLSVDGVLGEKSNRAIQLAITRLQKEFAKRGWSWNPTFNFIGIRTDDDFDNRFDDFFVCFAYNTLIACEASTVSGMQGVLNGPNKWHKGVNGTLVIQADQQIDYLFVDPNDAKCEAYLQTVFGNSEQAKAFKNWSGGAFLYQNNNFYYLRDNDGDNLIDYTKVYYGGAWEIGGNIHSWKNFEGQTVENLSIGCQVTNWTWWEYHIVPLFRKFHENYNIRYSLMKIDNNSFV